MNRRNFLSKSVLAAGATSLGTTATALASSPTNVDPYKYKLLYAPHFGMFENSAGKDLFDQLKFMADNGFMALEDNGMLKRTVETQTKIGETLAKLGMKMGVFVVDGGENWKISLATGKKNFSKIS